MNNSILLEQYKLYVDLMDRVSQRRQQCNQFYLSLVTALAGASLIFSGDKQDFDKHLLAGTALLCLFIALLWWLALTSYRQLNRSKFVVIDTLEDQLSHACFRQEWEVLQQDRRPWVYNQLSHIERAVPVAIALLSSGTLFYLLVWEH